LKMHFGWEARLKPTPNRTRKVPALRLRLVVARATWPPTPLTAVPVPAVPNRGKLVNRAAMAVQLPGKGPAPDKTAVVQARRGKERRPAKRAKAPVLDLEQEPGLELERLQVQPVQEEMARERAARPQVGSPVGRLVGARMAPALVHRLMDPAGLQLKEAPIFHRCHLASRPVRMGFLIRQTRDCPSSCPSRVRLLRIRAKSGLAAEGPTTVVSLAPKMAAECALGEPKEARQRA